MKEKGLINTKTLPLQLAARSKARMAPGKKPTAKEPTKKQEERKPIFAINLKFGERTETVRYFQGDSLPHIARGIAVRNSM